jgi:aspartate-semialdehyde dehydrogenase
VTTLDWTLDPNGYTEEENKVINETRKILGLSQLGVTVTCVRVPVRVSHSEAVNIEFERPISVSQARKALADAPGVVLMDETQGQVPQPIHAEGRDEVFVGRIRRDDSVPHGLNLWLVADNLRKGAASNAVQIAEHLVRMIPSGHAAVSP